MTVHAYYDQDDRQLMVGCCDGAHEVLYPMDDPEAVTRLLDALAEAGVLGVEKRREWCYGAPSFADGSYVDFVRYSAVVPWKEAK